MVDSTTALNAIAVILSFGLAIMVIIGAHALMLLQGLRDDMAGRRSGAGEGKN